jgi:hypothetical protein
MSITLGPFVVQCRTCNNVISDNSVYHSSCHKYEFVVFDALTNVKLNEKTHISTSFLDAQAKYSSIICVPCSESKNLPAILGVAVVFVPSGGDDQDNQPSYEMSQLEGRYTLFTKAVKSTTLGFDSYSYISKHIQNRHCIKDGDGGDGGGGGGSGGSGGSSSSRSSDPDNTAMVEYDDQNDLLIASPFTLKSEHDSLSNEVLKLKKIILNMCSHLPNRGSFLENLNGIDQGEKEEEINDDDDDEEVNTANDEDNRNNILNKKHKVLVTPLNQRKKKQRNN